MQERVHSYSERALEASDALFNLLYLLLQTNAALSWWVINSIINTVQTPKAYSREELQAVHETDKKNLLNEFQNKERGVQLAQGKKEISFLFRPRLQSTSRITTLSQFNKILDIDNVAQIAHVGGMITFYDLVLETLKHGLLPQVVPELRGITVGGSVVGLALESSSFKYGLVHETVTEMEVLTGEGEIRQCKPDNEYRDLFYGLPNSYGTLGYAVSVKMKLVRAAPFVELAHTKFHDLHEYFKAIEESCQRREEYDFIDGAIFSPDLMVMTRAKFVDSAPFASNYLQDGIYYKSMQEKDKDYLTTYDYMWRWDIDSFWSTKGTPFQNPYFRQLLGSFVMRGDRFRRIEKFIGEFNLHFGKLKAAVTDNYATEFKESIIQDVGIPIANCADFTRWAGENIGIFPMFVCPDRSPNKDDKFPLWNFNTGGALACDIGIFGRKTLAAGSANGYYNRKIEAAVDAYGGKKSLYSQSFFDKPTFDRLYCNDGYDELKAKYDPANRFPGLYEKTVQNR